MVNPLPEKLLLDFAKGKELLLVVEELDPVIETYCKSLGLSVHGKDVLPMTGEFSQNLLAEKLSKAFPKLAELIGTIPSGENLMKRLESSAGDVRWMPTPWIILYIVKE